MFRSKDFDRYFFWFGFVVFGGIFGFVVNHTNLVETHVNASDSRETHVNASDSRETHVNASLQIPSQRQTLRRIYTSQIGIREKTGKNDGPEVEKYLMYIGLSQGYSYCAAYVCWCLHEAGIGNPKNGWAPALFPEKRVVWGKDAMHGVSTTHRATPRTGDVFGIYFSELKRIGHCGFVDSWDGTWMISVEANTNNTGAILSADDPSHPIRAGPVEGVYCKKRLIKTIYKAADWISK